MKNKIQITFSIIISIFSLFSCSSSPSIEISYSRDEFIVKYDELVKNRSDIASFCVTRVSGEINSYGKINNKATLLVNDTKKGMLNALVLGKHFIPTTFIDGEHFGAEIGSILGYGTAFEENYKCVDDVYIMTLKGPLNIDSKVYLESVLTVSFSHDSLIKSISFSGKNNNVLFTCSLTFDNYLNKVDISKDDFKNKYTDIINKCPTLYQEAYTIGSLNDLEFNSYTDVFALTDFTYLNSELSYATSAITSIRNTKALNSFLNAASQNSIFSYCGTNLFAYLTFNDSSNYHIYCFDSSGYTTHYYYDGLFDGTKTTCAMDVDNYLVASYKNKNEFIIEYDNYVNNRPNEKYLDTLAFSYRFNTEGEKVNEEFTSGKYFLDTFTSALGYDRYYVPFLKQYTYDACVGFENGNSFFTDFVDLAKRDFIEGSVEETFYLTSNSLVYLLEGINSGGNLKTIYTISFNEVALARSISKTVFTNDEFKNTVASSFTHFNDYLSYSNSDQIDVYNLYEKNITRRKRKPTSTKYEYFDHELDKISKRKSSPLNLENGVFYFKDENLLFLKENGIGAAYLTVDDFNNFLDSLKDYSSKFYINSTYKFIIIDYKIDDATSYKLSYNDYGYLVNIDMIINNVTNRYIFIDYH